MKGIVEAFSKYKKFQLKGNFCMMVCIFHVCGKPLWWKICEIKHETNWSFKVVSFVKSTNVFMIFSASKLQEQKKIMLKLKAQLCIKKFRSNIWYLIYFPRTIFLVMILSLFFPSATNSTKKIPLKIHVKLFRDLTKQSCSAVSFENTSKSNW